MRATSGQIEQFTNSVLKALGVTADQRESVVRNILWNEIDGRANFGLQRLPIYAERLTLGGINPDANPTVSALKDATASIDGDNGFGQYASEIAMQTAISMAKKCGIGICTVKHSNFFGSGAYYVNQACSAGMIGIAMSNSYPKVAAFGGDKPVLGTNPFAFGAPKASGDTLIADFATSALAGSSVRQLIERGEPVPSNAIVDQQNSTDIVLKPFGGAKGFSLSLIVEILSGILAGAGVGFGVNSMYKDQTLPGENGHFLMALDVSNWGSLVHFVDRVSLLEDSMTDLGQTRWPGAERADIRRDALENGVQISGSTMTTLNDLAESLNLPRLRL